MIDDNKKPTMVIVSTLFFNRIGNQSLLETVKQYVKKYKIIFITSASKKNDYYMDVNICKEIFEDDIVFFHVYQRIPFFIKKFLSIFLGKSTTIHKQPSSLFLNTSYGKLNVLSSKLGAFFLYLYLVAVIKKYKPELVCAYEVFAVKPVVKAKKKFIDLPIKYFAKFQGTVLGFDYNNITSPDVYKRYCFDIEAFNLCPQFDLCSITNDGTNGDKVLESFGVDKCKILYEPNGVSEYIKTIKSNIRIDTNFDGIEKINLFTLSRLIGWKRVNLSIEIMNTLVNDYHNTKYFLNIYGHGNKAEVDVLSNLIVKYHLQDYVCIRGAAEHDELLNVYNDNHIMISLYKYTNVTNPVIESIYINKPVITLHDSNLDKILKNIETDRVFLYKEINEDSLIKEIASFLNSKHFVFSKENKGVEDVFDWKNRINKELELLSNCKHYE